MPEALKEGGGGHLQPYSTNDGRFGSNNNGGTSEPTGNGAPAPSEQNESAIDFDDIFSFCDEYESGKTEEQLAEEDKMFEEEEDEIEKIYGRRTDNPSFETIVSEGLGGFPYLNCYINTMGCLLKIKGYDCKIRGRVSPKLADWYNKHIANNNDLFKVSGGSRQFYIFDESGNIIKYNDRTEPVSGGFDLTKKSDGSYEINNYPLYEIFFKDYKPSMTKVYYKTEGEDFEKIESDWKQTLNNIKEGEYYSLFVGYHYTLLTKKDNKFHVLDGYHRDVGEYSAEDLNSLIRGKDKATLTRVDNLKINEETVEYYLDKNEKKW